MQKASRFGAGNWQTIASSRTAAYAETSVAEEKCCLHYFVKNFDSLKL